MSQASEAYKALMGDRMGIYSPHGTKVRFDNYGGYEFQREEADKILERERVYTIDKTVVHSSSTQVYLVEHPGVSFNSVQFAQIEAISIDGVKCNCAPEYSHLCWKCGGTGWLKQ